MNILQINASYKPAYIYGGPTISVSKLSEELVKNGHTVQVFTTTANGTTELPVTTTATQQVSGVAVRYFKRLTKDHTHFSPQLLLALWKEVPGFDLVHIHTWWNLVSIGSCCIALLRHVPVVLSPRGTLSPYSFTNKHNFIKKLFHQIAGRYLLNCCHLHSTSEREQTALALLLKPKSTFQCYNLVNLPDDLPRLQYKKGKLQLLFLSRIEKKKGLDLLLDALARLTIPYELTIAGSGGEAYIGKLKKRALETGIDEHIHWVGFKNHDKFELMSRHHLLVLPSYDENFGHVVIESLAVGTAVLISKEVGLADYVQQNNLGWICDTTVSSIAEKLNAIYHSQGRLDMLREFAPAMVISKFQDAQLIEKYVDMYQQVSQHTSPYD